MASRSPGPGVVASDERTVSLLGRLYSEFNSSQPQEARKALTKAVKIITREREGEVGYGDGTDLSDEHSDGVGMEASIAASIQRQLVRTGKRDQDTGIPLSVRFAEIHEKMSRKGHLKHYGSLLRLLNQLSRHYNPLDSASNTMVPFKVIGGENFNNSHGSKPANNERASLRKLKYFRIKERDDFQSLHERDLVRDVLFVAQGIDGKYVKFFPSEDKYSIDPQYVVSPQAQELTTNLCEIGWLYRRMQQEVQSFEDDTEEDQGDGGSHMTQQVGSTQQAFFSSVRDHLAHYYRMLALVESKVMGSSNSSENNTGGAGSRDLIERDMKGLKVTLRCLAIMLSEPMQQLRVLAILCDGVKNLKGGMLINKLFQLGKHGDPYVKTLVDGILHKVCKPLFSMISRWMFEGEVHDPCGEFFIQENASVSLDELWRDGYSLRAEMIPVVISDPLAKIILRTGKSINFLKRCCKVKDWGDFHSMSDEAASSLQFQVSGGKSTGALALESFVHKVAKRVDTHLMHTLFYNFRCGDHLQAIRRYLLLGQGDFIQQLMDLSGADLSEKAGVVSAYQLSSTLETAIRSSVVQFDDPEILDCLKVEMMPHAGEEYGWDVFSLNYVVQSPLTSLFTETAMKKYLRVFNFLWRLKRVEHALSSIWQAMKPSVQLFDRVRNQQSENVLGIKDEVRRCHCVRNEMSNFCMNLQYYIMFVVLAESWTEFEEKIKNASDLDTLILAHETYLGNIVEKALLGDRSQALVRQLNLIFDLIMRFQGFSGRIQEILQEASSKRRMRTLRAEMETAQGNWGVGGEEQADPEVEMDIDCFPERFLYSTRFELDAITGDYRVLVDGFLKLFSTVPHIDLGSLEQKINLHYDA
jgi:gamma-tubulin complex component 3